MATGGHALIHHGDQPATVEIVNRQIHRLRLSEGKADVRAAVKRIGKVLLENEIDRQLHFTGFAAGGNRVNHDAGILKQHLPLSDPGADLIPLNQILGIVGDDLERFSG